MLPTMRATPFVLTTALALATAACAPPTRDARGLAVDTPSPAGDLETVQQPARVCADGPTVDGIDVSFYQEVIDWNQVAQSSVKFAIVRIGDGLGEDDQFENNWNGARNAGLIRGAYQFFRAARDPDAMADIVIRKVGRLGPGDLPVVLDLEGASIQDQAPATVIANARRWLAAVEAGTGKRPIIYTGFYVWRDQIGDPDFSEYPLWIAAYVNRCPDISDHWNRWTFWQTSDSGRIPGIDGNVDTDLFNGDLAALQRLADGGGTPYGARFEAQSFPYASEVIPMTVGDRLEGWFDLRNTGTETWGANTYFAPTPRDQTGPFGPEGWASQTRISACPQATPPGEVCRFPVVLTAHAPGETLQTFGLVQEGQAWFSDPGQGGPPDDQLAVRIQVSPGPPRPDAAGPLPDADGPSDALGAGGDVVPPEDRDASHGGDEPPPFGGNVAPPGDRDARVDSTDARPGTADGALQRQDAAPGNPLANVAPSPPGARLEGGCAFMAPHHGPPAGGPLLCLAGLFVGRIARRRVSRRDRRGLHPAG
jgi:lysozyme